MAMNKRKAMKNFTDYLKSHNIFYESSIDDGIQRITMVYPVENAPDKRIESCIWFYEDVAEVRTYYSALGAEICRKSERIDELLHLLNFINARVFLSCGYPGGLYEPHMLYTPRIYITEDGYFDITITTMVHFDFWNLASLETADYITIYCPELLERLTYAVFGVLLGQITFEDAKTFIEEEIMTRK